MMPGLGISYLLVVFCLHCAEPKSFVVSEIHDGGMCWDMAMYAEWYSDQTDTIKGKKVHRVQMQAYCIEERHA